MNRLYSLYIKDILDAIKSINYFIEGQKFDDFVLVIKHPVQLLENLK
jgi:uncharacterized protein with HEPN domain